MCVVVCAGRPAGVSLYLTKWFVFVLCYSNHDGCSDAGGETWGQPGFTFREGWRGWTVGGEQSWKDDGLCGWVEDRRYSQIQYKAGGALTATTQTQGNNLWMIISLETCFSHICDHCVVSVLLLNKAVFFIVCSWMCAVDSFQLCTGSLDRVILLWIVYCVCGRIPLRFMLKSESVSVQLVYFLPPSCCHTQTFNVLDLCIKSKVLIICSCLPVRGDQVTRCCLAGVDCISVRAEMLHHHLQLDELWLIKN